MLTAKYPGTCKTCNGYFTRGEQIDWNKGAGSSHARCVAPAPAAATQARIVATDKVFCMDCGKADFVDETLVGLDRANLGYAPARCERCHYRHGERRARRWTAR